MHTHLIRTAYASVAFAAANEGAAGGKAPNPASESTPAADAAVTTQIIAVTDETKVTSITKALGKQRTVFATFGEAFAKLQKAAGDSENFHGLPIAIVGYDEEADTVDESIYEGQRAVLATVGARVKDAKGKINSGIKAVVIFPIPTVEAFIAGDDAAKAYIDKVLVKEASHQTFRNFRDAATVAELMNGAKAAPTTVDAYVTASTRDGDDLDTDTFDALWVGLRNTLKAEQPVLHSLLPSKAEVIKAIRSKSYAESEKELAPLEEKNVFVKLGRALINGAAANVNKDGTPNPLDPAAIEAWLAGRDTLEITKRTVAEKDFAALDTLNW